MGEKYKNAKADTMSTDRKIQTPRSVYCPLLFLRSFAIILFIVIVFPQFPDRIEQHVHEFTPCLAAGQFPIDASVFKHNDPVTEGSGKGVMGNHEYGGFQFLFACRKESMTARQDLLSRFPVGSSANII